MARKPKVKQIVKPSDGGGSVTLYDSDRATIAAHYARVVDGWDAMSDRARNAMLDKAERVRDRQTFASVKVDDDKRLVPGDGIGTTEWIIGLMDTHGTGSLDLINRRARDAMNYAESITSSASQVQQHVNATLAFIDGAKPADTVQATLALQMALTHDAALRALTAIGNSEWVPTSQAFGNLGVKLLNVYAKQAETLAKLQRGGEQVVRHIHIDNRHGGQAIVTDTLQTGGSMTQLEGQSHATYGLGTSPALLSESPDREAVPIASSQGQGAVPDARRDE